MAQIGPTAYYTGRVWSRNGLSHPEFDRLAGKLLHLATEPTMRASSIVGGPTIESFLLARHLVIDALLEEAIEAGTVTQVLEVACGLSPRGWRFTERHPDLVYVEADLPDMAAEKRAALERIGRPPTHRVIELDALADEMPIGEFDRSGGLAVITEGLLSYLPRDAVLTLWERFAGLIGAFPGGVYLSDLHVDEDVFAPLARAFEAALSVFVQSRVSVHFDTAEEAERALLDAGFGSARVFPAAEHPAAPHEPGAGRVRVVRARP
jgi:O-methyltransferase involved in polyketide biosynthesis